MSRIDTSRNYILTNDLTNNDYVLGVRSNGTAPIMQPSSDIGDTHRWFLTATKLVPYYRLHIVSKGRGFSLDVINSTGVKSTELHLGETNDIYPGQFWRFDEWETKGDGGLRVSNNFTGHDLLLDVSSDKLLPMLGTGDFDSQRWRLNDVADFSPSSRPPPTAPDGTGTSQPPTGSHTVAAEEAGRENAQEMPGAQIAGIVIGALAVLAMFIVGIGLVLRYRTKTGRPGVAEPDGKAGHLGRAVGSGPASAPAGSGVVSPGWTVTSGTPVSANHEHVSPVSPLSSQVTHRRLDTPDHAGPVKQAMPAELPSPEAVEYPHRRYSALESPIL